MDSLSYQIGGKMQLKATAKINLILEIIGKRTDGYHELKSLMIPIDYYDTLTFIECDYIQLESNVEIKDNAVLKVAHYMKDNYKVDKGVKIVLDKQIPLGSGLAGGSADISQTINGLNRFWNLNLTNEELDTIANQFGSDTLFQRYSKPAIISGRGDLIEFIQPIESIKEILLILPNIEILTKDVFQVFQKQMKYDFNTVYQEVLKGNLNLYNDLLEPALKVSKKLKTLYDKLIEHQLPVHLSGSGSTLFILNPSQTDIAIINTIKDITFIIKKTV